MTRTATICIYDSMGKGSGKLINSFMKKSQKEEILNEIIELKGEILDPNFKDFHGWKRKALKMTSSIKPKREDSIYRLRNISFFSLKSNPLHKHPKGTASYHANKRLSEIFLIEQRNHENKGRREAAEIMDLLFHFLKGDYRMPVVKSIEEKTDNSEVKEPGVSVRKIIADYATILGIIIAILGFFGIRDYKDMVNRRKGSKTDKRLRVVESDSSDFKTYPYPYKDTTQNPNHIQEIQHKQ